MERRYRLQKNKAFQYVYHRGKSVACRDLVMLVAKSKGMKVGFSVSKKYGGAVERNRIRRQMEAVMATLMPQVKGGFNLVVIPRKSEPYLHKDIVLSLTKLLKRAELV